MSLEVEDQILFDHGSKFLFYSLSILKGFRNENSNGLLRIEMNERMLRTNSSFVIVISMNTTDIMGWVI